MKRHMQISCYKINTNKANYIVALERLKNTSSGAPRYKAIIMVDNNQNNAQWLYNAVYTFKGHYFGDVEECRWIVEQYEGGQGND